MKYHRIIFIIPFLLLLIGCWDEEKSPQVVNMSGQDISLRLIFNERKESFIIENKDSLLLPNLLEEKGLERVELVGKDGKTLVITKKKLIDYMNKTYTIFKVTENFSIQAEVKR